MRNTSGIFFALSVAGFLLLSACGQKGPLFIPDEQVVEQTKDRDAENNKKIKNSLTLSMDSINTK